MLLHVVDSCALDAEYIALFAARGGCSRLDQLFQGGAGVVGEFGEECLRSVICEHVMFDVVEMGDELGICEGPHVDY